ncbi:recombination regulator RecX [Alcaligenaceae bacterium]|nr:recombination regulator RecX [Alcaligenaceae bacterium]
MSRHDDDFETLANKPARQGGVKGERARAASGSARADAVGPSAGAVVDNSAHGSAGQVSRSTSRYDTEHDQPDDEASVYTRTSTQRSSRQASRSSRAGPSLKARAIGYLSRREHSRTELQRKLLPYAEEPESLEALLNDLERENWLSDQRFAQSLVNRRAERQGTQRIVQELRQHGLPDDAVSRIGEQLRQTELERAQAVWQKKFDQLPADSKEYARQFRFLGSRGFDPETIRRILGDIPYGP